MSEEKFSIFHIEGGLGKHIAATAVARTIKNNHPERELIVVCAWPEIFLNLPFVHRVYRIGTTPYFYEDYIKGKDSLIFKHEPYFTTDHIHQRSHLIQNWCQLYDLEWQGEEPVLRFNLRQMQVGINRWRRNKLVLVLHTNGGPLSNQPYPYSWTRDMPPFLGQQIVNATKDKYHIIQICRNEANALQGVEVVTEQMSNLELFYLLTMSEKRILIDSCLQHAAAALKAPSTVLWVGTSPTVFGYEIHTNIKAKFSDEVKMPDSYLFDYDFNGRIHECPILDPEAMFDLSEILASIGVK